MPDPTSNAEWKANVRESIRAGAELNGAFLLMNTLAATIACYGLFANSPAVIIGAMIVAMLLGPITGVALSLVDSNLRLLRQSLITLLAGTAAVVTVGFAIGLFHHNIPITDEIMARTSPNLIDLMVALAGGAAGAYASVSPRLSVAFVGVAIATALVPPLCSASILFAHGQFGLGMGAVLLTFTNMVAIQFASSVVFWLTGFHRVSHASGMTFFTFLKKNTVSIVILVILSVVLTSSLHQTVSQQLFESNVRYVLQQNMNEEAGDYLSSVRFETIRDKASAGSTIVRAVVRGPHSPSAAQVAQMDSKLPSPPDGTELELRIRFVHAAVMTRNGQLFKDLPFGESE